MSFQPLFAILNSCKHQCSASSFFHAHVAANVTNVCLAAQTLRVRDSVSEQESVQVAVTRLLVESYYDIVRASLQDSVPKAIMHFLVLFVQRGLQQHLIRTLYRCVLICAHITCTCMHIGDCLILCCIKWGVF